MEVRIDYDLCMGDRNCNKVCAEVFEYDEEQLISRVLVDVVPESLEEKVLQAESEVEIDREIRGEMQEPDAELEKKSQDLKIDAELDALKKQMGK